MISPDFDCPDLASLAERAAHDGDLSAAETKQLGKSWTEIASSVQGARSKHHDEKLRLEYALETMFALVAELRRQLAKDEDSDRVDSREADALGEAVIW